MHATLINPNLLASAATEASQKDSRKSPASPAAAERSFQHVLTHARKPAKSEHSGAKIEKPKSGKADKGKQAGSANGTAEKRVKPGPADSDESDDDSASDSPDNSRKNQNGAADDASDAEKDAGDDASTAEHASAESGDADSNGNGHAEDAATLSNHAVNQASSLPEARKTGANGAQQATGERSHLEQPIQNQALLDFRSSQANRNASGGSSADPSAVSGSTTAVAARLESPQGLAADGEDGARGASAASTTATNAAGDDDSSESDSDADSELSDAGANGSPASSPLPPSAAAAQAPVANDARATDSAGAAVSQSSFANVLQTLSGQSASGASPTSAVNGNSAPRPAAAANPNPGARFVAENHPNIVQSVKTQLLPSGGTMRLRLDPPELGAMQVSVHVKNGVVTASFETSNDQATKMLSHSLGQLKQALESQGITVGKMHVQQSAKNENPGDASSESDSGSNQSKENTSSSQQDEQRRETLRRMWERLSIGGDPLDLVA